jgi:hypothetical protein
MKLDKVKSKFKQATKWDYENSLRKVKDTKNFEIDKAGRFAARFFQMALALISYYWLAAQNQTFLKNSGIAGVVSSMMYVSLIRFFAIVSPVISGLNIAVYITPWFGKNWTSRRILAIETFSDLFMTVGWIAGFIALLNGVTFNCAPGGAMPTGCVEFNWLAAWLFFLFLAWFTGLIFDIFAWKKGVFDAGEIDDEVLLDVRRATRSSRLK